MNSNRPTSFTTQVTSNNLSIGGYRYPSPTSSSTAIPAYSSHSITTSSAIPVTYTSTQTITEGETITSIRYRQSLQQQHQQQHQQQQTSLSENNINGYNSTFNQQYNSQNNNSNSYGNNNNQNNNINNQNIGSNYPTNIDYPTPMKLSAGHISNIAKNILLDHSRGNNAASVGTVVVGGGSNDEALQRLVASEGFQE